VKNGTIDSSLWRDTNAIRHVVTEPIELMSEMKRYPEDVRPCRKEGTKTLGEDYIQGVVDLPPVLVPLLYAVVDE